MDNDANGEQDERDDGVPNQDAEPVVDAPVMDGAEELQAEAAEAVASGDVDLTDTQYGGPSVVEESPGKD